MRRNFKLVLSLFTVFSFLLFSFSSVYAASGPLGLNGLRSEAGPGTGQVTLNWFRYYPNVDNYSISYGTQPGVYQWGVSNIGNNVVYTIGGLNPGQTYYFFVYPSSQGVALPSVSPEISEVAASAPRTVIGTAGPYGQRSLTAVAGPGAGQVTLTWIQILSSTNNFSLMFGTQPGMYQYGALNIGNGISAPGTLNTYVVNLLHSGQRYYFSIVPMQSGTALYSSVEVSQVAP